MPVRPPLIVHASAPASASSATARAPDAAEWRGPLAVVRVSTRPARVSMIAPTMRIIDASIECFVSPALLYHHRVVNGSLVTARYRGHHACPRHRDGDGDNDGGGGGEREDSESGGTECVVRLIACNQCNKDSILVPPSVHWALRRPLPYGESDGNGHGDDDEGDSEASKLMFRLIVNAPTVSRITLARVLSPSSNGHAIYDEAVAHFFAQPRYLTNNAIIAVAKHRSDSRRMGLTHRQRPRNRNDDQIKDDENDQSDYDSESDEDEADTDCDSPSIIWYSVTESSPAALTTFTVDPNLTTIVTEGSQHAAVPYNFVRYLTSSPLSIYQRLPSLTPIYQNVRQLLLPSLKAFRHPFSLLLSLPSHSYKHSLLQGVAHSFHYHYYPINLATLSLTNLENLSVREIELKFKNVFFQSLEYSPCLLHLRHCQLLQSPVLVSVIKGYLQELKQSEILLVGTSINLSDCSAECQSLFTHTVSPPSLSLAQRTDVIDDTLASNTHSVGISKSDRQHISLHLASKTAGLSVGELIGLTNELLRQVKMESKKPSNYISLVNRIQENYSARFSSITGTLSSIPNVHWSDIGGLENVKSELIDLIELPKKFPALFSSGIKRRSGILLFGPPGTGKTLLAKAIATEFSMNFVSVKGPELLNQYVGESERNVRELFHRAKNLSPCILFFDEFDSLAPARGESNDGGGVMSRVVSALLTEFDSINASSNSNIYIIGATNRPDLLDPALLRPGRLDRLIYLGLSNDRQAYLKMLTALTRKFHLHSDVDFESLVSLMIERGNFTGADCFGLCTDAMIGALKRRIDHIDDEIRDYQQSVQQLYTDENDSSDDNELVTVTPLSYLHSLTSRELSVEVRQSDFVAALNGLTPSLSKDELRKYEQLRLQFAQRGATEGHTRRGDSTTLNAGTTASTNGKHAHMNGSSFDHSLPPANGLLY